MQPLKAGAHENVHRTGRTAAVDGLAQIATSPPGTALGGDCIAVQSKEMAGMTSCAEILAPPVHLLTAWRHDPAMHPNQLVHAVEPGGHVAECGVEVAVSDAPGPIPVPAPCSHGARSAPKPSRVPGSAPGRFQTSAELLAHIPNGQRGQLHNARTSSANEAATTSTAGCANGDGSPFPRPFDLRAA